MPPGPHRPRVLIADDDAGICAAMTRLLSRDCDVVGCVADVEALLDAIAQLQPDVVLLDFSLPGELNGFDVCRRVKRTTPAVNFVAFTADDDVEIRRSADEAGFSGFVWKMQAPSALLRMIQTVVGGTPRLSD